MPEAEPLPPHVIAFVEAHVTSLLQLETLLLVFESGQRPVTADRVAAQMYLGARVVKQWLDGFTAAGLAARTAEGYVLADSPAVYDILSDVADTYLKRRISLSRILFESPRRDPKTSLSDAFRLRTQP